MVHDKKRGVTELVPVIINILHILFATLSSYPTTCIPLLSMRGNAATNTQDDITNDTLLEDNYAIFRDCLADILIQLLDPTTTTTTKKPKRGATKARKNQIKPVQQPANIADDARKNDAEDLADFIEYIASELWPCLPVELRTLDYAAVRNNEALSAKYAPPLPLSTLEEVAAVVPPSVFDSLAAYSLFPLTNNHDNHTPAAPANDILLLPLLTAYTTPLTTPPPSVVLPSMPAQRSSSCELCARDWIPLTYHHLIPRSMHAKAVKRGWHQDWELANVAWLCRACHSFVHRVASNEELAREWFTVERLEEREDVRRFVGWVGGVRWKKR